MGILRICQTTFLVFALTISLDAQQIASKHLLRQPVSVTTPAQAEETPEYPNGCSKMGVGFADGVTLDQDKVPRKIRVELVKISKTKLAIGSEIVATAKLQNTGSKSIQIPWSTDFRTTMDGQNPDDRSWEFGEFQMSLRNKQNTYYDRLVTTSQPTMEWFQTVRTRVVKDCGVTLGYFPYDSFYNHENRVVVRKVEIRPPAKTQKSSQ